MSDEKQNNSNGKKFQNSSPTKDKKSAAELQMPFDDEGDEFDHEEEKGQEQESQITGIQET